MTDGKIMFPTSIRDSFYHGKTVCQTWPMETQSRYNVHNLQYFYPNRNVINEKQVL